MSDTKKQDGVDTKHVTAQSKMGFGTHRNLTIGQVYKAYKSYLLNAIEDPEMCKYPSIAWFKRKWLILEAENLVKAPDEDTTMVANKSFDSGLDEMAKAAE